MTSASHGFSWSSLQLTISSILRAYCLLHIFKIFMYFRFLDNNESMDAATCARGGSDLYERGRIGLVKLLWDWQAAGLPVWRAVGDGP